MVTTFANILTKYIGDYMGYDMTMEVSALNEIFVEFYYWITVPLMFLIHVGFCLYEVSVSRAKNHIPVSYTHLTLPTKRIV